MRDNVPLGFDWDDSNTGHLKRHKISREEFEQAMRNDPLIIDYSNVNSEDRWSALGMTDTLRILLLCYTVRGERVRPVTAWPANKRLREAYFRRKAM
jgi:uncharacterized DUF497 family protein